jgi:hypothetical protein
LHKGINVWPDLSGNETAAEFRRRARLFRLHASCLSEDAAAMKLIDLADKLEAQAAVMEAASEQPLEW